MTKDEQLEYYKLLNNRILKLAESKGSDYGSEDILSNFKIQSEVVSALNLNIYKPEQFALFMVILKINRLINLLNSDKKPKHESLEDSFLDGESYMRLAHMLYKENYEKLRKKF